VKVAVTGFRLDSHSRTPIYNPTVVASTFFVTPSSAVQMSHHLVDSGTWTCGLSDEFYPNDGDVYLSLVSGGRGRFDFSCENTDVTRAYVLVDGDSEGVHSNALIGV